MPKAHVVTILDKANINDVMAGSSAPKSENIDSNFGTINIKSPRLTLTAKTRIKIG